jgi:hypothetical protein
MLLQTTGLLQLGTCRKGVSKPQSLHCFAGNAVDLFAASWHESLPPTATGQPLPESPKLPCSLSATRQSLYCSRSVTPIISGSCRLFPCKVLHQPTKRCSAAPAPAASHMDSSCASTSSSSFPSVSKPRVLQSVCCADTLLWLLLQHHTDELLG